MKRNHKQMWRTVVSIALVFTLVFGMSATAFATTDSGSTGTKETINYVSLGDSMTNGYGLPGYEYDNGGSDTVNVNGFLQKAEGAYPTEFAAWLTDQGYTVNHTQLATSAQRAEDIRYMLEYGKEDAYAGDDYTHGSALGHYEEYFDEHGGSDDYVADAAAIIQDAVADADVITIGVGANNFSTFMTQRIGYIAKEISPTFSFSSGERFGSDVADLIADGDEEVKAQIDEIYQQVKAMLEEEVAAQGITLNDDLKFFCDEMAEAAAYTTVGFTIGYKGIIDDVLEVNPDAEIVIVDLTNWLEDLVVTIPMEDGTVFEAPVGEVLDVLYEAANVYMAALPAAYDTIAKANGEAGYNIYYAETGDVEMLIEQIANEKALPEGDAQKRFLRDVSDMIFKPMMSAVDSSFGETLSIAGLEKHKIAKAEILNGNDAYYQDYNYVYETYLGFEKAFIETAGLETMDANGFLTLVTEDGLQNELGPVLTTNWYDEYSLNFSDALCDGMIKDNSVMQTLFHLYATYIAGNGIGCHPSDAGHQTMADAVIKAYSEGYTATDFTVAKAEEYLTQMYDLLIKYGPDIYAYAEEQGYIAEMEQAVADLLDYANAEAQKYAEQIKPEIEKQIAALEAQLAELKAQADKAAKEEIAKIEKQIAELEALLADIEARINALYEAAEDAQAAMDALLKAMQDKAAEDITAALKDIQTALNKVAAAVEYVEGVVADINAAIDEAIATIEKIDAALKQLEKDIKASVEEAKKVAAEIKAQLEIIAADAETYVKEAAEAANILYTNATTGYYTVKDTSYYVALGDTATLNGKATFGTKLADALGLDKEQYSEQAIDGLRADDLRAILDTDYEADAYGQALIKDVFGDVATANEELTAEIQAADLITLSFGNNTITEFTREQTMAAMAGEAVEMDWTRYVGEKGAKAIEKALAEMSRYLVQEGLEADMANALTTAIESYAYGYTGFACNYPEAVNAIKEINPDAQVIIVGMYNPFENAEITVEGTTVPVGEFIGTLVDLSNVHYTGYAMATGNAIYVDAPDVTVEKTFTEAMDTNALMELLLNGTEGMTATAEGHAYIAEQILNALTVMDKDTWAAMQALEALRDLEITRDNLDEAKALVEKARAAYDALNDDQKAQIPQELVELLLSCEVKIAEIELEIQNEKNAADEAKIKELQDRLAALKAVLKLTESATTATVKVVSKTNVTANWAAVEGADEYKVVLTRNGKTYKTATTDDTSITWKNVTRGCEYKVTVTPVAEFEGKEFTGIAKASAAANSKLSKAAVTVKKVGKKVRVKSADQNSTGFQIYISKDKKFKKGVKKVTVKTNEKKLNKKLTTKKYFKSGKNYIKVRAYTKVNGKTVYGKWSKVKTVKVK